MRFHPKVTIAIPVYNGANYLDQAIESALGQTYDDVEVIVVNDGSTDNGATEAVARRYGHRITYIHQPNGGVGAAMNTAIANMTGDVFTWLSHDDIHLPKKVSAQVEFFDRIGKRDAILFSDYYLMNNAGEVWHETKLPFDQYAKTPMLPLLNGAINGCTLFVPVHILREFGPFDETLRFVQDYELWNKILSKYEFFLQPEPLAKYRIHPGQDTHKPVAIVEGDALWIRMLDSRNEIERVQIFGSTKRFYTEMAEFLSKTPYKCAAEHVQARANIAVAETLVSVVVPFRDSLDEATRAARSVLAQTHSMLELILVDDGFDGDFSALSDLVASDPRMRLLAQGQLGANQARNLGMLAARGDYIAFIAPGDVFEPSKITVQLAALQDAGHVFSHTSYALLRPAPDEALTVQSGALNGEILSQFTEVCPIATSTVMLHRSLVSAGFLFGLASEADGGWVTWAEVARSHQLLGIDEPLTVLAYPPAHNAEEARALAAFWVMHNEVMATEEGVTKGLRRLADAFDSYARLYRNIGEVPNASRSTRLCSAEEVSWDQGDKGATDMASAENRLLRVKRLLEAGHARQAVNVILETDPSFTSTQGQKLQNLYAIALRALFDFQGSLQVYKDLRRKHGAGGYGRELALGSVLAGESESASQAIARYLDTWPADKWFFFELASCLAFKGRLIEADEIFSQNIRIPTANGLFADTSSCRFSRPPATTDPRHSRFLATRRVDFDRAVAPQAAPADVVFFLSGDEAYLNRFLVSAVQSFEQRSGLRGIVHVHAIQPGADTFDQIERLRQNSTLPIALSSEVFDTDRISPVGRKSYYSIARFLMLPEILEHYRSTVLMADVDQIIAGDLSETVRCANRHDIALLTLATNIFNVLNWFSATFSIINPSENGRAFAKRARDYLIDRMIAVGDQIPWHLDQAALSYAKLSSADLRCMNIPETALGPADGSETSLNFGSEAVLFRSFTASLHPNSRGPHRTNCRSVLVADIDVYSVVGGGQVLFRSLMRNNPSIDFYYLSKGPDLELKAAGKIGANVYPLPLVPDAGLHPFFAVPIIDAATSYAALALQTAASCIGRSFDAVEIPSYLPVGAFLRDAFAMFGVTAEKVILGLHGWVSVGIRNQYDAAQLELARLAFERLERATVDVADTVYSVSEQHRAETENLFAKPVTVIDMHSVLDPPHLAPLDPPELGKPDLWFVGRLDRNKGPDLFVEIVSRLPRDAYGAVHAAGPDLPLSEGRTCAGVMIEQGQRLGVNVTYEGELPPDTLRRRVFNGRTIVIVPSRSDTFNLVALEAVTSGTPLLLSSAAGADQFLSTEHPAIPVMRMSPDDIPAAAAALSAFLSEYPQSADAFRRAVQSEPWPRLQPDFMKELYLDRTGVEKPPHGPATDSPFVKLQPDPRLRVARADWSWADPRLTIIVPTYRRPEWLINCLASIAQEKPPHTCVLVIDDGSPPEMQVPAIVGFYAPFARVITTENRGEANAVNLGIAEADTPFVMVLSDDDVIEGEWAGRAVEALEETGAVLAYPDWAIIDQAGAILEEHRLVDCNLERLVGDHWCLPGPGAVFRRQDAMAVGRRNGAVRYVSDYDFWLRLSARGSFQHVPMRGAYWRYHGENATFAKDQRLAEEHVEIIAADVARRRKAGTPLPGATELRALATAHLAAGVILSRSPGDVVLHVHFLLAHLLAPTAIRDLPPNIVAYEQSYPAWLRTLIAQSDSDSARPTSVPEYAALFSRILRAKANDLARMATKRKDSMQTATQQSASGAETPPAVSLSLDSVTTEDLAAEFLTRLRTAPGNPFYNLFEEAGFHLLRKHYYVPLPEKEDIPPEAWTRRSALAGLDMNEAAAHHLMDVVLPPYLREFRARFPIHGGPEQEGFYLINATYMAVDAHLLYGLVRHAKPKRIVEIGNGASTMVAIAAAELNRAEGYPVEVISIDPYPNPKFANGYPGLDQLIPKKIQDIPVSLFESLQDNDIFFIDSSHVLRTGNDVEHEYLNLLPILKNGVYVHVHDISLPLPYPKTYFDHQLYWNEQQLLQAFLAFNYRFKVIWPGNYMMVNFPEKMMKVFPEIADMRAVWTSSEPTAFWMRVGGL